MQQPQQDTFTWRHFLILTHFLAKCLAMPALVTGVRKWLGVRFMSWQCLVGGYLVFPIAMGFAAQHADPKRPVLMDPTYLGLLSFFYLPSYFMQLGMNGRAARKGTPVHSYSEGAPFLFRHVGRFFRCEYGKGFSVFGEPLLMVLLGLLINLGNLPLGMFFIVSGVSLFVMQAGIECSRDTLRLDMTDGQIETELPTEAAPEIHQASAAPGGQTFRRRGPQNRMRGG